MTVTLPKGTGFYLTDQYPIGGSFHRSGEDLQITVERTFPYFHGTNAEGKDQNGRKVAFDLRLTAERRTA